MCNFCCIEISKQSSNGKKLCLLLPICCTIFLIAGSYILYVMVFCLQTVDNFCQKITYISCYHVIYGLLSWSFYKCVITKENMVPKEFKLTDEEFLRYCNITNEEDRAILLDLLFREKGITGYERQVCIKCKQIKPDRSHHCSICNRCVLMMDHHCIWVNNCISFSTLKYFILFVTYGFSHALYVITTTRKYVMQLMFTNDYSSKCVCLFLLFISSITIGTALLMFSLIHWILILKNATTIEFFYPHKTNVNYKRGCWKNFKEVFGKYPWLWLLPISTTSGNGINFPVKYLPNDV